jgi:hypothetical protein
MSWHTYHTKTLPDRYPTLARHYFKMSNTFSQNYQNAKDSPTFSQQMEPGCVLRTLFRSWFDQSPQARRNLVPNPILDFLAQKLYRQEVLFILLSSDTCFLPFKALLRSEGYNTIFPLCMKDHVWPRNLTKRWANNSYQMQILTTMMKMLWICCSSLRKERLSQKRGGGPASLRRKRRWHFK